MQINYLDFNRDPWGTLGAIVGATYGSIWNKNANERQSAKADKIIEEMKNQQEIERIANMRSTPAENAAQAIVNDNAQRQAAQAVGQITGLGNLGVNKGVDYMGMGAQYAEQQDPFKFSAPSALDTLKSSLGKDRAVANAMRATASDYQQQASLTPAQRKATNWNPGYTEDNVRSRLKQAGINKEIIDEKMVDVKNDVAKRARDVLVPSIMQNLYGTMDEQGNYKAPTPMDSMKAMIDLQTLAQYDPATAKMLSTGTISPRDIYNEQLYEKRREDERKDAEEKFKREVAIRRIYGAGNRGTRTTNARPDNGFYFGRLYFKDLDAANKQIEAWRASENPQLKQQANMLEAHIASLAFSEENTGNGSAFANRDPDWNNYDDAMTAGLEALKVKSKEEVYKGLKEQMGDGPLFRNVATDLGIMPASKTKEPEYVEPIGRYRQNQSNFLSYGANPNERTGFAKALEEGRGLDYFLNTKAFDNW
jgi:hypothetical protein